MSLLPVSSFLLQSQWKDVISFVRESASQVLQGPHARQRAEKAEGLPGGWCLGRRWLSGRHWPLPPWRVTGGGRRGLRGPSQHRGLRAGAGNAPARGSTPAQGLPCAGVCSRDSQEEEASTIPATGHPRARRQSPPAGPVEAAGTPHPPSSLAQSCDGTQPRPPDSQSLDWGCWGHSPRSATSF